MLTGSSSGRALPVMVAATARNPELAAAYTEFIAERRASSAVPIERAMRGGELSLDVDISLMLDLLVAPVFYPRSSAVSRSTTRSSRTSSIRCCTRSRDVVERPAQRSLVTTQTQLTPVSDGALASTAFLVTYS